MVNAQGVRRARLQYTYGIGIEGSACAYTHHSYPKSRGPSQIFSAGSLYYNDRTARQRPRSRRHLRVKACLATAVLHGLHKPSQRRRTGRI